jgi:hypothetical protein
MGAPAIKLENGAALRLADPSNNTMDHDVIYGIGENEMCVLFRTDALSRAHGALSRAHGALSRAHGALSRAHGALSRARAAATTPRRPSP